MTPNPLRSPPILPRWAHLPLCLALGAVLSLIDRTDANWDLQNYHLYAPFALLHGRLGWDYFAAAYQGYFNPLADVPYYLVKFVAFPQAPRMVALLAGLPFGLLVFIVLRLASVFVAGGWAAFFATIIGVSGATTLSEVGTTFDDILVTDFVLLAMLILVRQGRRAELLAGFAFGLAVAMKLTMALFALPLAGMVLVLAQERRLPRLVLLGAAAALGFAAGYGWWGWQLWRHYADPFFPMFSSVFHTPWAIAVDPQDARFFPKTWLQWLAYPFFWLQGKPYVVSELYIRDPRFALAFLAALAGCWSLARRHVPPRPVLALWLFFVAGYLIWLLGFSILRYAMPLEALTGVFMASVLAMFGTRRLGWVMAALAVLCLGVTKPMGWGRIGYGKALVMSPVPVLPPQALVLMAGHPIGFTVPYLARPDSRFVSLDELRGGTPEWAVLRQVLAAHPPVLLLTNALGTDPAIANALAGLGLAQAGPCAPVHSAVQDGIQLCPLRGGS
jgi:hypothetical protein